MATQTPPQARRASSPPAPPPSPRGGWFALIGGALQFLGVGLEWVLRPQQGDGEVLQPVAFAVGVGLWVVGTGLLAVALAGWRSGLTVAGPPLPRRGRAGALVGALGNLTLLAFGVIVAITGLGSGRPAEWSFLLFALGYLLAGVGYLALASGLRSAGGVEGLWWLPLVAAAGILAALTIPLDPWHDIGLSMASLSWVVFGALVVWRRRPR